MPIAHKYLCEMLKILHCDISVGNILLYRADENEEANGLLVDFDFAKTIKDDESSGASDDGEGQHIFGEVNAQTTCTKTGGNGVWTVSGIYTYINTINNAILRGPPPLLPSKPYSSIQIPSGSNLPMIWNQFSMLFFISVHFSKDQAC
jgi:hypothetical protein